jgi:hypothetical protein
MGSIIDNTTNDVTAISITSGVTNAMQRCVFRDFGIVHEAPTKYAIQLNLEGAYGQIDNVVIRCNDLGHGGVLFGDEIAATVARSWEGSVNQLRVDDATGYCIRVNSTGHTWEFRNCSPRTSFAGAHAMYINQRNVNIYGGQYGATGAGGIPIYFHCIDAQSHARGSVNDVVFEGVAVGEYAIVIDGTTFGFNKVELHRCGIQLINSQGTLVKFGRTSDSVLNLPTVLGPTGGGILAEWGEFSVDCSVVVDLDTSKAPVTVHASATRARMIVVGRIPAASVVNITTATNLTVILRDGIVELPGIVPIHNGVSWNYVPSSPAQLVANTNDYNPTGLGHNLVFRLSTDASRNLTGIVAQAGGTRMTIVNVGAFDLVLMNQDGASSGGYRFMCPGSVDLTLNTFDSVDLLYDDTSNRWRVLEA